MNDSQWQKFTQLCDKSFEGCEFQEDLIDACLGHDDIAKVVYYHNKKSSFKWLKSKIPAMDNLTPIKEIEKGNIEIVRNILLSFPY